MGSFFGGGGATTDIPAPPEPLPPLPEGPTRDETARIREQRETIRKRAGHRGTVLTSGALEPASTAPQTLLGV